MAWLSQHGIDFEERDIMKNSAWVDDLAELNASATPTTVVEWDDHREVIIGFDERRLTELLLEDPS
jgi:glutaredoxin-like protein NrdH